MKYFLFLVSMALTTGVCAQSDDTLTVKSERPIEIKHISFDGFPSAKYDLGKYLATNLRYPKWALERNIQGRVIVKFMVNEGGEISDVEEVKSVHEQLDAEAVRVVKEMKPWRPAIQNGKPVKMPVTLPVVFKLDDQQTQKDVERK